MKFEVMSQCHGFRKRILWHLNSIEKQTGVEVIAHVAVCDEEHHNYIKKYFPKTKILMVPKHIFGLRGYCRNRQVANIDKNVDYAVFVDCDQVYDLGYFDEIDNLCKENKLDKQRAVVGVSRESWAVEYAEKQIEDEIVNFYREGELDFDLLTYSIKKTNSVLPSNLTCCEAKSKRYSTRNVCAGYFQMTHVSNLNGKYIHGVTRDKDTLKLGKTHMRSDIQFRKEIGTVLKWKTDLNQYHLNHDRDYTKEK